MRTVLHILTNPANNVASDVIARQKQLPDVTVETVDWRMTDPDVDRLLDQIFQADSVQVW